MGWLLDTHVCLWSQAEPQKLGPKTTTIFETTEEAIYVATISTLEISRLASLGKIEMDRPADEWVQAFIREIAGSSVDLTHRIAAAAYELPDFHRDPSDRILVATARQLDLTLITADGRILDYPHVQAHDARL